MARRDQPYLPLYVNDFLTDEKLGECSAAATGVYIRLMCIMHKSEDYGAILLKQKDKQSDNAIADFACKLTRQMPYTETVIERSLTELLDEGVIQLEDDRLFQKRMVRDGKLSEIRANAGSKGGTNTQKGRSASFKDKQGDNAIADFACSVDKAKLTPNTENESESVIENETDNKSDTGLEEDKTSTSDEMWARFNEFWEAYPRKENYGPARTAFFTLYPSAELFAKLMAAIEVAKQSEQWQRDDGRYIPNPDKWLNGRRWMDKPTPARSKKAAPTYTDYGNKNPFDD